MLPLMIRERLRFAVLPRRLLTSRVRAVLAARDKFDSVSGASGCGLHLEPARKQEAPVIPVENDPQRAPQASCPESSPWSGATRFARAYWLRLLVISAAMLTPCFWH